MAVSISGRYCFIQGFLFALLRKNTLQVSLDILCFMPLKFSNRAVKGREKERRRRKQGGEERKIEDLS